MFYYDYPVNWGEPVVSCNHASMTYNDKKKEIKWTAGSRISRIVPKKLGNAGGGKAGT